MVASYGIKPFLEPIMARLLGRGLDRSGYQSYWASSWEILVRRGHENRDPKGPHRLEVLVCRAVAAGAVTTE